MKSGAQPGNRNGAKGKEWRDALRKAIAQHQDKDAGIERGQALFHVAKRVLTDALAGDKAAAQEIGNRLDGRPAQSVTVSGDEENPLYVSGIGAVYEALRLASETEDDSGDAG